MSSNTDIIALLSSEADEAIDQIITDSQRLHVVVNGTGTDSATTEDGSLIPSVRKALVDNLYFKTPPIPWRNGTSVTVFNQLYSFSDVDGNVTWWYAPGATVSNPVVMQDSPINDGKFRVFLDKTNIADVYAPILSPLFRGNPRSPTPSPGDSSGTIPNTQWVQTELDVIRESIGEVGNKSDFDNITVREKATTKDLDVTGKITSTGTEIDALNALLRVKQIELPASTSRISFTTTAATPVGITKKTIINPFDLQTGTGNFDVVNTGTLKVGSSTSQGVTADFQGTTNADYVHISGNTADPVNDPRPQLIVDGIAEIGTLRVGDLEGFDISVDGLDISPRSVSATEFINSKDISATGLTTVNDLVITGTVTGITANVDGQDIRPNSVDAANQVVVGTNLTVGVDATISNNLGVVGTTTLQDVVINGTVTGLDLNVDGTVIRPSQVLADDLVRGKNIVADEDVTAPAAAFDTLTTDRIDLVPHTINPTSSEVTPDGLSSLYEILVDRNILVNPPVDLFTRGKGGSMLLYFTQDGTGGRLVTFSPEYVQIGDGEFDTSANATTIVQLLYRGTGQVIDTVITSRR